MTKFQVFSENVNGKAIHFSIYLSELRPMGGTPLYKAYEYVPPTKAKGYGVWAVLV